MASYLEYLNSELALPAPNPNSLLVLDLFAVCGGLALGFEAAGFRTVGFEMLDDACATYNRNLHGTCQKLFLEPGQDLVEAADVIVGGPPCQPFSVNGHQKGLNDSRDGFPTFLSAVKKYARVWHLRERPCRYSSILATNSRTLGATMLSLRELCSHSRTEPSQCRRKKSPFRAAPITQTSCARHHSALSGRQSRSRTKHAIWITRSPQRTLFRQPRSLTAFSITSTWLFMTANARHHPPPQTLVGK